MIKRSELYKPPRKNDYYLPPIGTLPDFDIDDRDYAEHGDVHMIIDVRSGLHVGYYTNRAEADQGRDWLRLDWPAAVLMIVDVPASEPWYAEPNRVRLDDRNMTRVYGHPPMREIEGLDLDLAKYQRMQVKLLRFFEKRPAKPPTWRHLKWIAGPDDAAGTVQIVVTDPETDVAETWTSGVSLEFVMCFGYLYDNHIAERPEK